jgi:hypothetical protein
LINNVQYKNFNHNKYDKLLLKNSQLENEPFASSEYMVNIGNAIDVLHRELPFIFIMKTPSFDIFSSQIMVVSNTKKISVPKKVYIASIKLLQTIASFSINRPEINVRKIEYIEDTKTIQCLVDIVLPKIIKSNWENKWEGYFYFGVNEKGIIKTHIFDRKISNLDVKHINVNPHHWLCCNSNHYLNICNKFQSFLKLMRVKGIPPTFLLCFSGGWIMNPSLPNLLKSVPFIVSVVNTLLITSASMVINDIFDINVDRINSPHRPLITGEVTMKEAYLLSALLLGGAEYLTFRFLPFNLQMIVLKVLKILFCNNPSALPIQLR